MGLFSKRTAAPQLFALPPDLRPDIRGVFETAPPDACHGLLREARNLPIVLALNEGLPSDERVVALTRCQETWRGGGYMVLTDRRLIFALQPNKDEQMADGPVETIAIDLSNISQFVFDSGMVAVNYGEEQIIVALVQGGPYSQAVCAEIKAALGRQGPYAL